MPKRSLTCELEKAAKIRRKSILISEPSQLANGDESEREVLVQKSGKHLQYIRSNQNNEIERLFLRNSKSLHYQVDHNFFPAFNVGLWPQKSNDGLSILPSCAFEVPRAIYVADKQCEKVDICYKRPLNWEFYKRRLKHSRTSYQTAIKSNKNIRSSIKEDIYHSLVFEMAERIYTQPDPFFQSSYDFYFSGGNLSVLPCNGHIIHTGDKKLREISVSEFPAICENSDGVSLHKIDSLKMPDNSEIFEVHPLITAPDGNRQNCFIVRQRNFVNFNFLNDDNKIKSSTLFRTQSTPFISFAQSDRDINNFIITTMKQHIRLYDLNSSAPSLVKLFEITPNTSNISWNTVKPWRENTFMYANEKQFFMIDIRTSPKQWLNEATFASDSSICDHISAILPSDFNNLFYIATSHKLQCMDIRNLKKYSLSDSGVICRWTHQLRYAPLMMDTFRLRQNEYIALSSPIAGDMHICQLSRERNDNNICLESSVRVPKHIYSSPCLPYQPPTLLEAYENARLSGKCLRPEANLEARLKCCTTGMTFLKSCLNNPSSGIGLLLTSNSNGDVFAHTLSKREEKETEERYNKQSDDIMAEFERKVCKQITLPLNYTEIKNMKGLRKVFLCKALSSGKKCGYDTVDSECDEDVAAANQATNPAKKPQRKRLHLGRWQKSLSTLHSYKDALVADLLSIWDIDIEEEENLRLGNLLDGVITEPSAKVKDWIKNNINPYLPMLSIPPQAIRRYSEMNNTSHTLDSVINISPTQNTTIDFENVVSTNFDTSALAIQIKNVATTTVVDRFKNKKKTKKYVKGF